MKSDPIVDEIRQARAQHAAKYGYDLDRIFSAIKEAEKKYGNRLVNREDKGPGSCSVPGNE